MAYKTIRRDGRNITIDTATGQEVGVGQGQLKPIFDALGLSNLNETLPLTLKQMGADIQNLPGDISRHLIYSDKVDEKGRPLTIAQANPQPRKLIPEIESYLAREGKSKPVGTKDQPKFADLRGSKTPGSVEAAVDNAAAVSAFAKAAEFQKANNSPTAPVVAPAPVSTPATGKAKLDPNATEEYKTAFNAGEKKMDDMLKYFGSQNNGENLKIWAEKHPALAYKEYKKAGMAGKEPFGYDEVVYGKLKENPAKNIKELGIDKLYDGQADDTRTPQEKFAQAFLGDAIKGLNFGKYGNLDANPYQIDPAAMLNQPVDFNIPGLEKPLGNYGSADYEELLKKYGNIFSNK
tara:strand:+ start:1107 stop:2153 length:1047 start_codon:yes stop_codon:yes gene_type:complete